MARPRGLGYIFRIAHMSGQASVNRILPRCLVAALAALLAFARPAAADDLALFHAAVEEFASHNRAAIGYLRTENIDLAALEIERMRQSWGVLAERFSKPPAALQGNPHYLSAFVSVPTQLVGVILVLKMGRPDAARQTLIGIRRELSDLRRASHVEVLADCILDANGAMDSLFGTREEPPDLASPSAAETIATRAAEYGAVIRRCDAMAPTDVRAQGEFRRLVDGIAASLAQVPQALTARDGDLLHRLLIELRSFDNLLAFRYG
jgi:hypothetical protein